MTTFLEREIRAEALRLSLVHFHQSAPKHVETAKIFEEWIMEGKPSPASDPKPPSE